MNSADKDVEIARLAQLVAELSTDPTGVMTRTAGQNVVDRMERELSRATYESLPEDVDEDFAVVFVDLDGLKSVNDTLGHDAGDDLLQRTAAALTGAVGRPNDYVIRWGGDEFLIVCKTDGYPQEPETLGALIRERVRNALTVAGVNASVGYSFTTHGVSLKNAIDNADKGMYEDKTLRKTSVIADALTGEEIVNV